MKKLLLFITVIGCIYNSNAQCDDVLPVTETFDDSSVMGVCWNVSDQDGDGNNWYWREYGATYGGYKCLTSRSWSSSQGNLDPDNWVYSHAIDLTSFNTNDDIEVTWKIRGENASFAHEYYTMYAATGNQISDFTSSSVKISEYADEVGAAGVFVTRNLDISSLAGNMVYLAFRHENISGSQFILNLDDVSISTSLLSNEDFNDFDFKHYYNKNSKTLTLNSKTAALSNVEIYNILGQQVLNKKLSYANEALDLSSIKNGVYIAKVQSSEATKTIKFIKH